MTFYERAQAAILKAGGRMTAQRRLILDVIADDPTTWDAESLYERLHLINPSISLATVYRTLNLLAEQGILTQRYISREHSRAYYERDTVDQMYHFTCRHCRKVIPFRSDLVLAMAMELERTYALDVSGVCVCFDGLCSECREKAANESEETA
jgi:Fur family transcriptional regulator, ferric uptake regulator